MHRYFHRLLLLLVAFCSFGFAQVAYQLSPVAHQQFFDFNGFPLSGGFVYTYASGSVTPLVTYKDNGGTANTNPIVLDAGGYATIYLGQSSYKFCVQNSSAVQQYCQDNIQNFQQVILSSANTWSANNFWTSGHLLEGTLLGFSAAGVTTADAGISRTAANTLACGNGTQGDVSCTLKLAKLNNGADLSLPTSADTLVGKATTDTLTNKTLTSPTITTPTLTGSKVDRIIATGAAPSCVFSTGGGTSPSCSLATDSTDLSGEIVATTGTGSPGSSGTITLTFSATYGTTASTCNFWAENVNTAWNARVSMLVGPRSTTSSTVAWDNNAIALSTSSAYVVGYSCFGK